MPAAPAKTPPRPTLPERRQTVLIVDDETDIVESLKALLEDGLPGVQVVTAETGQAGLLILKKEPVDLILSDYKMPGMNGIEFLSEARKILPGVPRILITAFPDLDLAIRAINDAKTENFITKPFEPGKAIEAVKKVLDAKRAEEQRKQAFARSLDALRREKQGSA